MGVATIQMIIFDDFPIVSSFNGNLHVCSSAPYWIENKASCYSRLVVFENDFLFFDNLLVGCKCYRSLHQRISKYLYILSVLAQGRKCGMILDRTFHRIVYSSKIAHGLFRFHPWTPTLAPTRTIEQSDFNIELGSRLEHGV